MPVHRVLLNLCTSRNRHTTVEVVTSHRTRLEEVGDCLKHLREEAECRKVTLGEEGRRFEEECDRVLQEVHERAQEWQHAIWRWKEEVDEKVRKVKYETTSVVRDRTK